MNEKLDKLQSIFQKTNGHCHLTGQKLIFQHYGQFGEPGAWEIEHSTPKSAGGTDHPNNLFPATISANRAKGNASNHTIRSQYGLTRAPLSEANRQKAHEKNAWKGLACGALAGLPFGPIGVGVCALIGALVGSEAELKK